MPKHLANAPTCQADSIYMSSCTSLPRHVNFIFPMRDIKPYLRSLTVNIWIGTFLALFGIVLALLGNELCYQSDFQQSSIVDYLRFIGFGVNLAHWVVIFRHYKLHTQIAEAFGEIFPKSKAYAGNILAPLGHFRSLAIDLLTVSFSPPPTIYTQFEFRQVDSMATLSLDDLMLALSLLRGVQFFKLFYLSSTTFNSRESFIL